MKKLLETMYILTPDSYIFHRNENICISIGGEEKASVPASQVDSIVLFGKNTFSVALLGFCGSRSITLSFADEWGNFEGRLCGAVSGNVLLRKRQYESLSDDDFVKSVVRHILLGKFHNSKEVLLRHARNASLSEQSEMFCHNAKKISNMTQQLLNCEDVDSMRGIEGSAATAYFSCFDTILTGKYRFITRSKRPPLNEVNAVLSFLYTMLAHDYTSALETVGLDPAAGYLHTLRPGRASFALDLMEELRAPLCDRLTFRMFNKGELSDVDFEANSDAVYLSEKGRRKVLTAWRNRKQDEITHPFLNEKIQIGLIPYVQAMLFARVLRGDLDMYPPFAWR